MRAWFEALAAVLERWRRPGEAFTAWLQGEETDFVRFNRARVRQAGTVRQAYLLLDWIAGRRHAAAEVALTGEEGSDRERLEHVVGRRRDALASVPEEPFLAYARGAPSSVRGRAGRVPSAAAAAETVVGVAGGADLVGLLASGRLWTGFANDEGQRNWEESESFNFDWSVYGEGGAAVMARYAGFEWSTEVLERRLAETSEALALAGAPARRITPGEYPAYLAPMALEEAFEQLAWSAFGLRAHRTRTTPLLRMAEGGARLASSVTLCEHTAGGIAPAFQEAGYPRPDRVPLIVEGAYRDCLVSPRSAAEYGVASNGAGTAEIPQSLDLAPGRLAGERALATLGTGVWVSNLWYTTWSDRNAARITGMTRFATFWVENGRVAAPLEPMRFDDSLYRMLGSALVDLTAERELLLDPGTYGRRSRRSAHLPGALLSTLRLTL